LLQVLALGEIPEMQAPAIFAAEQDLRHQSIFEGVRRAPFAGDHRVEAEMPPHVVAELLRAAIDFPAAERLESLVIHDEDAARRLALLVTERGHVDASRTAMHGVRPRVTGLLGDISRLDDLDDLRFAGIGLGIENVDARRPQTWNDQIAPLHMRMRSVRTQARGAGVPPEMMEFVARVYGGDSADDARIRSGRGIDIDHRNGIRRFSVGIERRHIGELFGRRFRRQTGRGIEARVRLPRRHGFLPWLNSLGHAMQGYQPADASRWHSTPHMADGKSEPDCDIKRFDLARYPM